MARITRISPSDSAWSIGSVGNNTDLAARGRIECFDRAHLRALGDEHEVGCAHELALEAPLTHASGDGTVAGALIAWEWNSCLSPQSRGEWANVTASRVATMPTRS